MEEFCENPSLKLFNRLEDRVKRILVQYSQKVMENQCSGNKRLANRILKYYYKRPIDITIDQLTLNHDRWRTSIKEGKYYYDEIQPNTLVFRGSGKYLELIKNKPTYFALEFYESAKYISFGTRRRKSDTPKDNFLVGVITKPLKLFKLDSIENINHILTESFLKDRELYEGLLRMFMKESDILKHRMHPTLSKSHSVYLQQVESSTKPFLFRRLYRVSIAKNDFVFVHWLCQHGFHGYSAGIFTTLPDRPHNPPGKFHGEIVICDPLSYVHVIGKINIQKPDSLESLQNILIKLQKQTPITSYYS